MKNLVNQVLDKKDDNESSFFIIHNILDPFFHIVRTFVEESLTKLNRSRILLRKGNHVDIKQGEEEYEKFRLSTLEFYDDLVILKTNIIKLPKYKKLYKSIYVVEELIDKSTKKVSLSKLPLPPKDFLRSNDKIHEGNIDWIIKKMKELWVKFSQIYATSRINYIISID